jgi:transposase
MARAFQTGVYTMQEIADYFGVHYSTVSRAVRRLESGNKSAADPAAKPGILARPDSKVSASPRLNVRQHIEPSGLSAVLGSFMHSDS